MAPQPIELRTSERGLFKRCQMRWYWTVVEGLRPVRDANPLWFGQAVHIALAEWYQLGLKRGEHPAVIFERVLEGDRSIRVGTDNDEWEAEFLDSRTLGIDMLKNYVDEYGRDESMHVIATEQTLERWIPALGSVKPRGIKYFLTVDGVYRDLVTGEVRLIEHKTAATINPGLLNLDYQAGSYLALADELLRAKKLIGPKERITGIHYNFLRKKQKDDRPMNADGLYCNKPQRKHFEDALKKKGISIAGLKVADLPALAAKHRIEVFGEPSKNQSSPLFERLLVPRSPEEMQMQIARIQEDAWHIERARHDDEYPLTKNPIAGGMLSCTSCPFFQMCQLDDAGDQESVEEYKANMFKTADPYEPYRKAA